MTAFSWFFLAAVLMQILAVDYFASLIVRARRRAHESAGPMLVPAIHVRRVVSGWRTAARALSIAVLAFFIGYLALVGNRDSATYPMFAIGVDLMIVGMVMQRGIVTYFSFLAALELHEHGIVCCGNFVPWRDISGYKWRHLPSGVAQLCIQFPQILYEVAVDRSTESEVDGIFVEHGIALVHG